MSKKFTRVIENFTCGNCGAEVTGNGYTNHCPECLYSRHVDNNPGDRAAKDTCGGLMRPEYVEMTADGYIIHHRCTVCDKTIPQKASPDDNFDEMLKINQSASEGVMTASALSADLDRYEADRTSSYKGGKHSKKRRPRKPAY